MTAKHACTLILAACLVVAPTGCVWNKRTPEVTSHFLKVVDAVTRFPIVGADVKLTAPGMMMMHRTDEGGRIDVGSHAFFMNPRPEAIEISKQGYIGVSFPLTNGLPRTVELSPVQH